MKTNLEDLFDAYIQKYEDLSKNISPDNTSFEFETALNALHKEFGQDIFQVIVGEIPKSKNDRITILTSMGILVFPRAIHWQHHREVLKSAPACRSNCAGLEQK